MSTAVFGASSFIEVRNLVKRYGDKLVLDGFNLTVERW